MNKKAKKSQMIPVGKITRTHGVRGAVKVHPYGETLATMVRGETLFLGADAQGKAGELTIESLAPQGNLFIVRFSQVTAMEAAQNIAGREVLLPEESLPPASEGEYYHYQLIGLVVETRDGKRVGVLRGIIETPANDVYAVDCEGREILIPAVDEVVWEVDLEGGRMVIDPPEGLIDVDDL